AKCILIIEFTRRLRREGPPLRQAVSLACRVRLRPVLMTSLATLIGLLPMAAKLGTGTEAYAPLARAIIGGLAASVVLTVFIVPAAYYALYRRQQEREAAKSSLSNFGKAQTAWLVCVVYLPIRCVCSKALTEHFGPSFFVLRSASLALATSLPSPSSRRMRPLCAIIP